MPVKDRPNYEYARSKKRYDLGLCRRCNSPRLPDGYFCFSCREKSKAYSRDKYRARRDANLCPNCGQQPRIDDSMYCEKCRIRANENQKRHTIKQKLSGICRTCQNPVAPGRSYCVDCLRAMADKARDQRYANRAKGLCKCGNQPVPGFKLCQKCRNSSKRNAVKTYRRKAYGGNWEKAYKRDNGSCQVCGTQEARLTVHHIDGHGESNSHAPNNSLDNLITLCQRCHNAFTTLCSPGKNLKKAIELLEIYMTANPG